MNDPIDHARHNGLNELPPTKFGPRDVRVASIGGRGLAVIDPLRQGGLPEGLARVWLISSNTETTFRVDRLYLYPTRSPAEVSRALQGYVHFLFYGPPHRPSPLIDRYFDAAHWGRAISLTRSFFLITGRPEDAGTVRRITPKHPDDLDPVVFGNREIKVADVPGQGLVVIDPQRQEGVTSGRTRIWRLRSNSEAVVITDNCHFEYPTSVAAVSEAVRGFAKFLRSGPSSSGESIAAEPRRRYTEAGEILPEWESIWEGDEDDEWIGGVDAQGGAHPSEYDEDPNDDRA
mgnify:CR=1 FL=1